jgi:hypothetical protein
MLLILHITIAMASLVYTGFVFLLPSKSKIRASQVLIVLTLVSGTYLVISTKANIVSACISGLVYTAAIYVGIAAASRKLASDNNIE